MGAGTAYRASDWTSEALLERKGQRTVSVVVPAKDEESTVAAVVERIRADFVREDGSGLVDEGVVAVGFLAAAAFLVFGADGL